MNYSSIKTVFCQSKKGDGGFPFERELTQVSVICDDKGRLFMQVYEENCFAENNGRPVTTIKDYAYPISDKDIITEENWEAYLIKNYADRIELQQNSYQGV